MKRIRIGKDISMRWEITTDGAAIPLEGRDLTIYIKSSAGIENNIPYRIDGNILIMTFYGYEQKRTGEYSITLWEKKGKPGQNVVDVIRAFELVRTSQEEDDFVGGDLQIESVDLGTENFDILTEGGYRAINIDTLQAEALKDSVNIKGKTYSNESFTLTLPKANLDSAGVMSADDKQTLQEHGNRIAQINTILDEHTESINAKITTDRIENGAVTIEKIATSAFDSTLSVSGNIAPADVVGEKLNELDKQVIYDITANNDGETFASLSALLSSENLSTLIPYAVRCGGMSIRFVQSSDNKYVQYRLMHTLDNASTAASDFANEANWQGVDSKIKDGSKNLIESGAVYTAVNLVKAELDSSLPLFLADKVIQPSDIKWVGNNDAYYSYLIPLHNNATLIIKGADTTNTGVFAFLKTVGEIGEYADFCTGYGLEGVLPNATKEESIPQDAAYLYVRKFVSGENVTPSSIIIDGVDLTHGLKDDINKLKTDVSALEGDVDNLQADVIIISGRHCAKTYILDAIFARPSTLVAGHYYIGASGKLYLINDNLTTTEIPRSIDDTYICDTVVYHFDGTDIISFDKTLNDEKLSNFPVPHKGWLSSVGECSNYNGSKHFVVSVVPGQQYTIIGNENNNNIYALLTSYTPPTADGDSYNMIEGSRKSGSGTGTIPEGCSYLWASLQYANAARAAVSVVIDGYDYAKDICTNTTTLVKRVKNIEDKLDEKIRGVEITAIPLNIESPAETPIFPTLFAVSIDNSKNVINGYGEHSHELPIGWLYYDRTNNADVYYSGGVADRLKKLFTFDKTAGSVASKGLRFFSCCICPNGDIIFVPRAENNNDRSGAPILYKQTENYATAHLVNAVDTNSAGESIHPCGWFANSGLEVIKSDGTIIFAEYVRPHHEPANIWKVVPPYDDPTSWSIVYASTGTGEGTREIEHFHSVNYDPFTGYLYAATGDGVYEAKILMSTDEGDTWTVAFDAAGDEIRRNMARALNFVFTKDYCYYGSDNASWVLRVGRGQNDILDWTTVERIVDRNGYDSLPNTSDEVSGWTYFTCLIDEPFGLLLLQRNEAHNGKRVNVYFYDINANEFQKIQSLPAISQSAFNGFRCEAVNVYQSRAEKRIVCGFAQAANQNEMAGNMGNSEDYNNLALKVY